MFVMENDNKFINYGVVLKYSLSKIFVLDYRLGKIACHLKLPKLNLSLINGAYITYNLEQINKFYCMFNVKILNVPNNIVSHSYCNLIFFHHVLEICYYFLPLNYNENIDIVFNLILKLYDNNIDNLNLTLFRSLFLCNLFRILDIYPECIDAIALEQNIIDIFDSNSSINFNSNLKLWLTLCISSQPYYNCLKTISFLKELDIYE